jgi:hypothetical protein
MPLTFKDPPSAAMAQLSQALQLVAKRSRQGFTADQARFPHPVYVLGLDEVAKSTLIANVARHVSWRYLILTSPASSAEISVWGKEPKFSELNYGVYAQNSLNQIEALQASPQFGREEYEVRLLRIPALNVSALWLCSPAQDVFVPIAPTSSALRAGSLYSEHELLHALQPEATQLRKSAKHVKEQAGQLRSQEEIEGAIRALSADELLRLRQYARVRIGILLTRDKARGRQPHDLLQEAVVATLNRRRTWREGISFVQHLMGAMRSISFQWARAATEIHPDATSASADDRFSLDETWSTDIPDQQRNAEAKEKLEKLRKFFATDPLALRVADLRGLGYNDKEIQSELSLSDHEFGAASKRLRRNLQSWTQEEGTI